jgi:hypothetical protein
MLVEARETIQEAVGEHVMLKIRNLVNKTSTVRSTWRALCNLSSSRPWTFSQSALKSDEAQRLFRLLWGLWKPEPPWKPRKDDQCVQTFSTVLVCLLSRQTNENILSAKKFTCVGPSQRTNYLELLVYVAFRY